MMTEELENMKIAEEVPFLHHADPGLCLQICNADYTGRRSKVEGKMMDNNSKLPVMNILRDIRVFSQTADMI